MGPIRPIGDASRLPLTGWTQPPKHSVEFVATEKQRGGSAVGAVMRVVVKIFLFQQAGDLFRPQGVASFDGRLARNG